MPCEERSIDERRKVGQCIARNNAKKFRNDLEPAVEIPHESLCDIGCTRVENPASPTERNFRYENLLLATFGREDSTCTSTTRISRQFRIVVRIRTIKCE